MKFVASILPLAALGSAIVIPDEAVMNEISLESKSHDIFDKYASSAHDLIDDAGHGISKAFKKANAVIDDTVDCATDFFEDAAGYANARFKDLDDEFTKMAEGHRPPHGKHPRGPHKPHEPLDLTVYQMISQSKYSTKLAKLIDEFDDIVELLNSTKANVTVFAPTDKAFERIPEHGEKPPKELIKSVLLYHVVPDINSAWSVLGKHTLPTYLEEESLSADPKKNPQRLSVKLGWLGLYIDSYSKFGNNGVVHAVDHILVPPPPAGAIVKFFPTAFSTYILAARSSGYKVPPHVGSTVFIPPNNAWSKLGVKANAFLFSKYGRKYLKAILEYHAVANQTLYSDVFYGPEDDEKANNVPKGLYHLDLPTTLEGKSLGVDIARYGRFIEMKVNAFTRVFFQDVAAKDGVLQVINNVLIPPRKLGDEEVHYNGEELSVEELKERLAPYVGDEDEEDDGSLEL